VKDGREWIGSRVLQDTRLETIRCPQIGQADRSLCSNWWKVPADASAGA